MVFFRRKAKTLYFECVFDFIIILIKKFTHFSIRNGGVFMLKEKNLPQFFEEYLKKGSVFKEKQVLQANYLPSDIHHRTVQIHQVRVVVAPALRLERPSNLFIYGKTGTGKTLSVKQVINEELVPTAKKAGISIQTLYVNCKLDADTEYGLFTELASQIGKELPSTGLSTDEVCGAFFSEADSTKGILVIILDEIDYLMKKAGDDFLYRITRKNEQLKNTQVAIIGISNDLMFAEHLDPRVKSSLSEEKLLFPPYNAVELQDILNNRASSAFKPGSIGAGVVEKCAAYAAREHGDARRALDLLRVAGELADRKGATSVAVADVDSAEEKIDYDTVAELVTTQPRQAQLVLYSILNINPVAGKFIFTGEVYELYKKYCAQANLRPLTQRRVSDILSEFDMLGIITARVISKGRYGRTREIMLAPQAATPVVRRLLEEALNL